MITLDEALKKIMELAKPLGSELVPVSRTLGRVLREDLKSPLAIPPFDRSAMDGYAVKSANVSGASKKSPVELKVIGEIPAGDVGEFRLEKGTAARIMTGAPIPAGADSVVMVEDTEQTDEGVKIFAGSSKGDNIAKAGEDIKKGEIALSAGSIIGPAEMGMIASTGIPKVPVGIRPRVVVLSTGNELVSPGKKIAPGMIFDSNSYSLTGMAIERGGQSRLMGVASDREGSLEGKIIRAGNFDVLVLSGGVSVGDYDLVQNILFDMGVKELFWKVLIKPGMPVFGGLYDDNRFVFGLPGNPVSAMVTFELFVRPVLDVMLGRTEIGPMRGKAILQNDAQIKPSRRKFYRGKLTQENGKLKVELYDHQKSGILRSMVESDVLVDIPDGVSKLKAGSSVDIVFMGEFGWRSFRTSIKTAMHGWLT